MSSIILGSFNSVEQDFNSRKFDLENAEFEFFCSVIPLEKNEALQAIHNLKKFLNTKKSLNFEKLNGGDCNAPILVFEVRDFDKSSLGVLKHGPNSSWAEKRMKAIDEMKSDGFDQFPNILKDINGNYLVKLGEKFFSCIEYLEADFDQSSSIEQMLKITSNFHAYSKRSSFTEQLRQEDLNLYSNESSLNITKELREWNGLLFKTEAWKNCVKSARYFISQTFLEVYNNLPKQLIHGDITPNNTIISKGKSFFIDLDKLRTDVRLLDFATFLGWSFLEDYLTLTEENKLFPYIQMYYGPLEEVEKENFHVIVLYRRCGILEWCLRELKQAVINKDLEKEKQFGKILKGTIREINEIYHRIPQIKEIIYRCQA